MSRKTPCPDGATLESWFDGRTDSEGARRIRSHIDGCSGCRKRVEWLERIGSLLGQAASLPAPPVDTERVWRAILSSRRVKDRSVSWRVMAPVAMAVAVLLAMVLWPADNVSKGGRGKSLTPAAETVLSGTAGEFARVQFVSGEAQGLEWSDNGLVVPAGKVLVLDQDSVVAFWPAAGLRLLSAGPARMRWKGRGMVEIERGRLLVELAPDAGTGATVETPFAEIRVTGTRFGVEVDGHTLVEMLEGTVGIYAGTDNLVNVSAPDCVRAGQGKVEKVDCTGMAVQMAGLSGGDDPTACEAGWLRIETDIARALVRLDGKVVGQSPLVVSHCPAKVRVQAFAGRLMAAAEVRVEAGKLEERRLVLSLPDRTETPEQQVSGSSPAAVPRAGDGFDPSRVRHLLARHMFDQARRLLERRLASRPDDVEALMLAGDLHRLTGQAKKAVEYYALAEKAAGSGMQEEAAAYQRAVLLLRKLGDARSALKILQGLRSRYPAGLLADETAWTIIECRLKLKQYDAAVEDAREYLERFPDGAKTVEVKSVLEKLQGEREGNR